MYDRIIDHFNENISKKEGIFEEKIQKGKRPLKMPRNYDFSVRNVDWRQYNKDFLLRTDAVWEKSKLLDIFYTTYKVSTSIIYITRLNSCMTEELTST